MGIQSAVVLDLPNEKPTTTYITGMVTTFVTRLIQFLRFIEASPETSKQRHEMAAMSLAGPWIYGLTWLVYLAGAIAGSLLFSSVGDIALALPIVSLTAVILLGRNLAVPAATEVAKQMV
jgi:uncharacterized membrane protein YoaK (UPF0700 family)